MARLRAAAAAVCAAAVVSVGAVAVPSGPAAADTPNCASAREFRSIGIGMSVRQVRHRTDVRGKYRNLNRYLFGWSFKACRGHHIRYLIIFSSGTGLSVGKRITCSMREPG